MEQHFKELLRRIGFDEVIIKDEWQFLKKSYQGKKRHYHNLNHIKAMLFSFLKYKDTIENPDEVLYAIFYHDIIYKATRKDNEQKSAQYAVKILPQNAVVDQEFVLEAIVATQKHENEKKDIQWLLDFDLKVLGSDWEEYLEYTKQIRKEYCIYPDFLYKQGRKKALEHFLERDRIYYSQPFFEKYEKQARKNILQEIELIK